MLPLARLHRTARFALSALVALSLASCGEMTEEIWVNADGSGRYEMRYDASEMLAMLSMMDAMDESSDDEPADGGNDPEAEIRGLLGRERIDTVINIAAMMPDSVRDVVNDRRAMRQALEAEGRTVTEATLDSVQNAFASLEDLTMLLNVDKAAERLGFGMRVTFTQPREISETFASVGALQALNGQPASTGGMGGGMADKMSNQTTYELDGNTLRVRQSVTASLDELVEAMEGSESEMDAAQMEQALELMGLGAHDVVVHVPGKIKRVEGASYTQLDDNTLRLTVDYLDMLKGGEPLAADVKFKRKRKFARVLPE